MIILAPTPMARPQTGMHPTPILSLTLILLCPTLSHPPHLPIRSLPAPPALFPVLRLQPYCRIPLNDLVDVLDVSVQSTLLCLAHPLLCQALSPSPLLLAPRHLAPTPHFSVLLPQPILGLPFIGGLQSTLHVEGLLAPLPALN